ncbi:hypothetical protein OIDMADRAFT_104394 [Oidiodendron maius Zn]|uniref:Uncharacterized protein n=1 Tax=Oidiodendron maius (strain Zn) TaxID=913774 RepID=A0A0C3CN80_OIDMZ|nr:hypothetical protein OIDMADRAFT_104394 [Oidiodendron maius Zn]
MYRIGSLSKLLTVYTLLAEVGNENLDDPVTKYVPELAAAAAEDGKNELHNIRKEFLHGIAAPDPFASTFNTPLYSNAAFQILSYALEGMTNKSFADSFNSALVQPLNLSRTFLNSPPNNIDAIIPGNELTSLWGFDIGDESPAGGMYSTMTDLAIIGRSILRSSLLDPALTRKWMKPQAHTSSLYASIGMPWEIQRMELPLTDNCKVTRVVDLYTKSGDIGAYGGYMVLSPDHDIGFAVYAAGASSPVQSSILADLITATWIPAFEAAAREQAQTDYAGAYSSADPQLNSSIEIGLSDDRPGLGIESWISNGTDMLKAYGEIPTVGATAEQAVSARLYPVGLQEGNQIAFRALFEVLPQPIAGKVFSVNCGTWFTAGSVGYGEVALGDFVIEVDEATGKAVSINPRALRVVLAREAKA